MMDWAAALTYYSVLSIFPALIVLLSIVGVVGDSATTPILDNLEKVGPGPAHEIVDGGIKNIQKAGTTAGALLVVSLAVALWTASGYVGAFTRASDVIYAVPEERPMWKTLPVRLGLTPVLLLLVARAAPPWCSPAASPNRWKISWAWAQPRWRYGRWRSGRC